MSTSGTKFRESASDSSDVAEIVKVWLWSGECWRWGWEEVIISDNNDTVVSDVGWWCYSNVIWYLLTTTNYAMSDGAAMLHWGHSAWWWSIQPVPASLPASHWSTPDYWWDVDQSEAVLHGSVSCWPGGAGWRLRPVQTLSCSSRHWSCSGNTDHWYVV